MYTTHKKSIKNRILAGVGALFLATYAIADVMPAAARSVQPTEGYHSVPVYPPEENTSTDADIIEETIDELDVDMSTDEEIPYEDLSDEARQALAEENIPLAGYEEYLDEDVLSSNTMRMSAPMLLSGSSETDWDSWVVLPADKNADKLINHFDAAYSTDMLEDGDTAHYIARSKDFTIKYTVTLNTSKELETGNAVIRIPSALFKDRYGDPVTIRDKDGIALPKYSVDPTESGEGDATTIYTGGTVTKSTRTQFGYFIENEGTENETYVIVNYDKIKPGSTWFEIVYDRIAAFDVVDEQNINADAGHPLTWSIVPELTANYMFEKQRKVFVGNAPLESSDESTLAPIKYDWQDMLPEDYDESQIEVVSNSYGTYYMSDDIDPRYGDDVMLLYYKKDEAEPSYALIDNNDGTTSYQKWHDGQWVTIPEEENPRSAVDRATYCQNDFFRVMTTRSVNGQAVQVYTYYDGNGVAQYQEQVTDGVSRYYQPNASRTAWEEDPNVRTVIPPIQGDYQEFTKDSEALTGYVDTQAKLTDVKKTAGNVTDKVKGNLNSESQILAQIPESQRSSITNLDLDENIYVLWEVEISGKDCTQPFELYMDEHISYYKEQAGFSYTYYDAQTGNIFNASDAQDVLSKDGAKIIYVGGTETDTIANFNDDGTAAMDYSGYTDSNGSTDSNGYYLIGSSDPVKDESGKSPADLSGLTGVRSNGKFTKKVKVIVEYPRGNFPANGDITAQADGVCVDTLQESSDGALVYIPYGTIIQGKNTTYDLWALVNNSSMLDVERKASENIGILANRDAVKDVIHTILASELSASSTTEEISPVLNDFIDELAQNLPKTDELKDILNGMSTEQVKAYILESWKETETDANHQQIKKACEDYENEVLESNLSKLSITNASGTAITLQSYNEKKIYRNVSNDVNVILKPLDKSDPNQEKSDDADHTREDREPNIPNGFNHVKTASGSRTGWVDMYDSSADAEFGSTFSFKVNSTVTSFNETHPKSFAYFYDNRSYVHAITADDIITAEPFGIAADESLLYGRSYVLDENDYCYTAAKIIVNERVYNIVDDTSQYGATELSDDALINQSGSPADRNWYVYVSYGRDASGNTVWESTPYAILTMEDYMNESPSDYGNDSKGANVLNLDFSQDAQKPFRIKVEHNTIDYQSTVTMQLTAAIKKDSPKLSKDGDIRSAIYKAGDNTGFTSNDSQIDQFKMRLRNYMAFHTEVFELTKDENTNTITENSVKYIRDNSESTYTLLNTSLVDGNSSILDAEKLTDETGIPVEAVGKPAEQIMRSSAYVDVSTLEKESRAEKTSTYENDLIHGSAHITYRIAGYEGYQLDKSYKDELNKLNSYSMIPGENRNTIYIYDLLPPGVEFEGFSGGNEKPVAGFLKKKSNITDPSNWVDTDKITVSADVISENDGDEWKAWGGAANGNGRYLVKFTLTLPSNAEDYAVADEGNWFFGCGIQFTANVSWERYTAAKNTPNLAVYVTDSETIGKHGKSNKNEGTFKDDGTDVPTASEKGYQDIYKPFRYDADGTTSIEAYKQNFDCNGDTSPDTYNRMYASSMDLGDIARASSTAVGKQVRADADTYALFSEKTAVIKGEGYTYNVNVENQAGGAVSSIILYDLLDGAGDASNWQGIFQSIDTSMLTLNDIYPLVYYYVDGDSGLDVKTIKVPKITVAAGQKAALPDNEVKKYNSTDETKPDSETEWTYNQTTNKGWLLSSDDAVVNSNVRAVALVLYADTNHTEPYVLNGRNTLSYKISMRSPTNADLKQTKYAKNRPNYCYYKVEKTVNNEWVVDDTDSKYYDDPGNTTVVTLGERRMLKVAKHVESNLSDTESINDREFTFRITRRMMYQDGDNFVEGDVPCANIQYRIYACTFDKATGSIASLGAERDAGVIHTTNENGEFILHDGECAVFQYVPSTTVLRSGETSSDLQNQYDFDNYKITEMSKPFWYEFKSVDQSVTDAWYEYSDVTGVNNGTAEDPQPRDEAVYSGSTVHYKQTGITMTNTYRPVIYISKDTAGVPADMPTNPQGAAAASTPEDPITREEAFNTFDYDLWIYEYPIDHLTGEYFGNDEGYDVTTDSGTGTDAAGKKAAWLKLKEYYRGLDSNISAIQVKIDTLADSITDLQDDPDTNKDAIQKKNTEKEAWENLKNALTSDKEVIQAHVTKVGEDVFFAAPQEDVDGEWTGSGYLLRTVTNRLAMPISKYADTPENKTEKKFNNRISDKDTRENGDVLYTYTVGNTASIYESPEDWRHWETEGDDNKTRIDAATNPIKVKVRAGNIVALPIYIDGGMMYSDYAFTYENGEIIYNENKMPSYSARYCYKFQEAMDDKYWNDVAGEYKTVPYKAETTEPDTDERSWLVQTPADNAPYRNTLGVVNENVIDYTNNYRFKDIYLQKSVEPADHVPKGDAENSVDTTAFVYRVTRMASGETAFELPPTSQINRMSWELWTRDENGKLLEKQMTGAVNADGMILVPIANYTGKDTLYTVKVRNAEVGYTYRLEEIMTLEGLFGDAQDASAKKAALEAKFPYVVYDAEDNTFKYKCDTTETVFAGTIDRVFYPSDSDLDKEQVYTLATEELYAVDTSDTSGSLKIYDNDQITPSLSKVDMTIDNVYKLRNLTVTKSIIAKTIDNNMSFTMRVRRRDGAKFTPTAVRFYKLTNGVKTYLNDAQVNDLQSVMSGDYTPTIQTVTHVDTESGATVIDYYYLEFNLKNGIYAELVDIGKEFDEYLIQEKDWQDIGEEGAYVHLDPIMGENGWSAWKSAILGDHTTATVLNGDEGYMILSKTYVSDGAGDYDDYAKSILENDDNKVKLTFSLREKNSGTSFNTPTSIPEELVFVDGVSVTDLSSIEIKGGQNVVINLKGLCEELGIPYNDVEYKVEETIPEKIQYFDHKYTDSSSKEVEELYSVMRLTEDDEMEGDSSKTSIDIQNQVTKYSSVIYKRIGGNNNWTPPDTIEGDLVLKLTDGSKNGRQEGVKWIAVGKTFSLDSAKLPENHGVTGADGELKVHSFEGWSNAEDGNLTYYVRIFFNKTIECNLTRSENAQVLEIKEDLIRSADNWGYLIGYETYGDADTYVSQIALEDMTQWHRKQDTIVNTVQTIGTKKVEVYKQVYNKDGTLTDEDKDTEFTFTVKQWINGAYVPAPAVSYTITGVEGTFQTGADGTFALKHGQTASLDLPLFSYWEITETGKGDYRLLVDDNGEIVYDQGEQYVLDSGLDGLAPDSTAADPATYNAQRAASGFTLHTDFDIRAGIPLGDPVVLRSGMWDDKAKDYNFVLYDKNNDVVAPAENYYTTQSLSAKYYYINTNNVAYAINPYSESNESKKLNSTNVPDGVIYGAYDAVNNTFTNPVWAKEGNASYSDVNSFWNPSGKAISIPEYIYYKHSDGKVYRHPVIGIGHVAFKGKTNINSITIPSTVQKIGDAAFYNCSNITSFTFDQSTKKSELLSISRWGLQNTKPAELKLPEGLIELGTNALKLTNNNNKIYLPTTLSHCANEVLPVHINNGLIEIKSGLNNANGILGDGTETGVRYKDFCKIDSKDIWNNAGDVYKPKLLIFDNITNIKSYFMTDRNNLMRKIPIWVFSTDPEGGHTIVEDSMCVRTNFEGNNNIGNKLFIWRSSIIGDSEHQEVIFQHRDPSGGYDDYGLAAKDNAFTIVLTEIESTNTAQVDLLKKRFELSYDESTGKWYYDTKIYKSNKPIKFEVKVYFKDDISNMTASQILSNAGVTTYDIDGRVTAILNECINRTTAPAYPAPPVRTARTFCTFLAEALWLNDKKKSA